MLKTIFTTCAASALLVAANATVLPAYAQEGEEDVKKLEESQAPMAADKESEIPPDEGRVAAIPSGDAGIFIMEQDDDSIAASDYIGAAVTNYTGEEIGDVNDIIVTPDGVVEAIVVGVGGFLGMGERNVAVAFDAVKIVNDPDAGRFEFRVDASKEVLAAASEFLTVAEKLAMKRAEEAERQSQRPIDLNNTAPTTE